MTAEKSVQRNTSGLSALIRQIRTFFSAQGDILVERTSTPAMHGINLVGSDYTPSRLAEHPGCCSYEDIEPMK